MEELLTELRNQVLSLRNTKELSVKGELLLLNKLNSVKNQLNIPNNVEQKEYVSFLDWLESDETNNLQLETYSEIAAEYLKTKQS
jgi:hypothetical protein